MNKPQLFTSISQDWNTPSKLYEELNKEFCFEFDPCPNNPTFDGLKVEWADRNFVNPPYSTKLQNAFVKKALDESTKGRTSVLLIPVRTSSMRWQKYILNRSNVEIRFLNGRLKFERPDGNEGGVATFCSAVVIFWGVKNNY